MSGRGPVGKNTVIGAKDRAGNKVVARTAVLRNTETLHGFIGDHADPGATVYTDDFGAYKGMPFRHESVNHSVGEYVRAQAHTNGIESFWAMLKRGYQGTYHHMSEKHLQRYVSEFARRHNIREADTVAQMSEVFAGMIGQRLMYRIAD